MQLEVKATSSFIFGEVKVLFVKVCVPASVATVESIAIVPEDVIAPPDKPVPAVIEVTVPTFCGVIVVKVIDQILMLQSVSVVHKNILSSLTEP